MQTTSVSLRGHLSHILKYESSKQIGCGKGGGCRDLSVRVWFGEWLKALQTEGNSTDKDAEVGSSSLCLCQANEWKVGPPHPYLWTVYTGIFLHDGARDDLPHNPSNSVVTVTFG